MIYLHTHMQNNHHCIASLDNTNKKIGKQLIMTSPLGAKVSKRSNQNSEFQILRLLSNLSETFLSSDYIVRHVIATIFSVLGKLHLP